MGSQNSQKKSKHLKPPTAISGYQIMNKESMCVLLHLHKNGMIERSQSQKRKDPIIFSERNPHFIYYSEGSWRIKKSFPNSPFDHRKLFSFLVPMVKK